MATSAAAGIRFTETMRGFVAVGDVEDFHEAWQRGRRDHAALRFTLTVTVPDLTAMLADEQHEAQISGTVKSPVLEPGCLHVAGGRFFLFVADTGCPRTRRMIYRLPLESENGRRYFLHGYKMIRDDPGFDIWYDTTALFITVYEGDSDQGTVVGRGILRILLRDFGPQILSMRVVGTRGWWGRCSTMFRFLWFFTSVLAEVYLGGKLRRITGGT